MFKILLPGWYLLCWVCLPCWAGSAQPAMPPAIPLAKTFQDRPIAIPLTDYWVSEKLDGVRAIWDGQVLRTRAGHLIAAPDWFVQGFPKQALDGELWIARGQFERVSGIVRQQTPVDADWRLISYQLFELPEAPGDFSQRLGKLQAMVNTAQIPWLQVIAQRRVADQSELDKWLKAVVAAGGEGLMLHRANAPWLTGRTDALLKYKLFDDAEGVLVGLEPGKGKYVGQVGAFRIRLADGRIMRLGSGLSEYIRQHPPAVGTQITYRYRGLTQTGLPRFATFWQVRP